MLGLVALVVGFLVAAFRYGPVGGGDVTYRMLRTAVRDLFSLSPRRILALAWLAVQESLRRRVLVGFGVFLLILLFAGWFLDTTIDRSGHAVSELRAHGHHVPGAADGLVLERVQPAGRHQEPHDLHDRDQAGAAGRDRAGPHPRLFGDRHAAAGRDGPVQLLLRGARAESHARRRDRLAQTGRQRHHAACARAAPRWARTIATRSRSTPTATAAPTSRRGTGTKSTRESTATRPPTCVGPPQDLLTARVPAYAGTLRFKDRSGSGSDRGINVGNEWKYRSFIEGGTLAAAIWTFSDITPERFPDGLPIEMTIRVFRSYKGDIEKGILGSLVLKNPRTGRTSQIETFRAKDFYIDQRHIPRKLTDPTGKTIDLFDDLVADGELEIELQCLDQSQYFGVAQPDVYLRARDASFTAELRQELPGASGCRCCW